MCHRRREEEDRPPLSDIFAFGTGRVLGRSLGHRGMTRRRGGQGGSRGGNECPGKSSRAHAANERTSRGTQPTAASGFPVNKETRRRSSSNDFAVDTSDIKL